MNKFTALISISILLLSISTCLNAQEKKDPADPNFDHIVRTFDAPRWMPLRDPEKKDNQKSSNSDLESLQALSYLQGYNPAPKFKNVTVYDRNKSFDGYNLWVSAHAPAAMLMDMNGKTIHQWYYPSALLPVDHRYCSNYWVRARLLQNGDLLAMIDFGGLLKLDKNSHLLWFKNIVCHHDLDVDANGDIYILTAGILRLKNDAYIKNNFITVLSAQGETKKEISLYDLFNKYADPQYIQKIQAMGRIKNISSAPGGTATYSLLPGDAFHANSIQILDGKWAYKIPTFKKGNLLITVRSLGVIICIDPEKEEIVWLMDKVFWNWGEHFARLLENGHILIFDNYYRYNYSKLDLASGADLSRVVEFDPATKKIVWDYSDENGPFFSLIAGQAYRLPNGNTLIAESSNGRAIEVTPDKKIVWEFYNPHQVNKNIDLLPPPLKNRPIGEYDKLIAMIYQMQRLPKNGNWDWLKN